MSAPGLAALLRERGFKPRRSLGQNFLIDDNFLDAMVRDVGVGPQDEVIEIGGGPGNVTERLAERAARVWAFEVDPAIFAVAEERLRGRSNVVLSCRDGAEFGDVVAPAPGRRIKVVSSLPYSDWKRLALALLGTALPVESYTFMIQRDVWDRLRAAPGTRGYGPMSVVVQGLCEMKLLRRAGRRLFYPMPAVESALVGLRRREVVPDLPALEMKLRGLFAHRRKKCAAAGGRRVEGLAPAEILALCRTGGSCRERPSGV